MRDGRIRPLLPDGVREAEKIPTLFSDIHIDKVYSSTFKRAVDTVTPIAKAKGLHVIQIEEFRERRSDTGGKLSSHEIETAQWLNFDFTESDGESYRQVQQRNIPVLKKLISENAGKNIVIGTHGVAMCTMLKFFYELSFEKYKKIMLKMPYVVRLDFEDSNYIAHKELTPV